VIDSLITHLSQSTQVAIQRPSEDISIYTFPYDKDFQGAPIEIYIEIGTKSIPTTKEAILAQIVTAYKEFKRSHADIPTVNISVTEMNWCFELGL
jgi:hypothetical protein